MKEYTTPVVEKVTFSYEEHVVASGTDPIIGTRYAVAEDAPCTDY